MWEREFIQNASRTFAGGDVARSESGGTEREEELLKKLGELTVERYFLSQGLGRLR